MSPRETDRLCAGEGEGASAKQRGHLTLEISSKLGFGEEANVRDVGHRAAHYVEFSSHTMPLAFRDHTV